MTDLATLEPCPFCGSGASHGIVTEGGEANPDFGGHFVQCDNPNCHGCMGLRFACGDDPKPLLTEAWNTRAQSPALIAALREVERLRGALANPPKHRFWGAGEPDCPKEIKAGNGELHTLRCKVCGEDSPRDSICRWAIGTRESDADACLRFINELRTDYGTVTILPDNEEADTKAEQMAIDCCGEWTGWVDVRFYGESLLQCLAKAVSAKAASAKAKAALDPAHD